MEEVKRGRLQGKVAIITGAGNGIGRATAILFANEGAKVGIADINEEDGEKVRDEINNVHSGAAIFRKTDVSNESDVEMLVKDVVAAFGRVDILVNNAAAFNWGSVEKATEADWDKVLSVNVKGTAYCTKYASRVMLAQEGGKGCSIVNLASISSYIAQPNFVPYSTSKAAILGITRNTAMDLGPHIRVNAVAPGVIDTQPTKDACAVHGYPVEELDQKEGPRHMLRRVGHAEEIAYPILFLASDEASFITGTTLMVDGGYIAM